MIYFLHTLISETSCISDDISKVIYIFYSVKKYIIVYNYIFNKKSNVNFCEKKILDLSPVALITYHFKDSIPRSHV